ncbi:lipoprotein [Streptomyces albus]|uniref:Lipoprotein n=1 Tax=Streptomyces albus (strain ATCC 21838 / DSM 41398 / FERM P-419 / JCM 4703 / NBRC 107858) TaxID=1081613 RepID=A0A0B5ETD9_STRA4|nr:lipoprotein [Streptomyces albus]AOU79248.1 lipoprotein [Streptomyces albus]
MYRIRVLPAAVSLTAAAALLLTGCGGDDKGKDEDKIEGAGGETKSSAPASPSASKGPEIKRPDVSLPSDVTLTFAEKNLSDPKQAAALHDAQEFVRAIRHGITKQDPEDAAYKFYSEFQSAASKYAKEQIKKRVDAGYTSTGKAAYYSQKVSLPKGQDVAVVSFCNDSSEMFSKEVKTEKVHRTEKSLASFDFWQVAMAPAKSKEGLWRAKDVLVKGNAKECQR